MVSSPVGHTPSGPLFGSDHLARMVGGGGVPAGASLCTYTYPKGTGRPGLSQSGIWWTSLQVPTQPDRSAPGCEIDRCILELVWAILAAASVIALVIRERMWLRYCRYLHDQAVARGQDPDPAELIQAARGGRLQQMAEQVRQAITGEPDAKK
jgi:hypothetical protein